MVVNPRGYSIVLKACKAIVKFGGTLYSLHKSDYSSQQQAQIETLLDVAKNLIELLNPFVGA